MIDLATLPPRTKARYLAVALRNVRLRAAGDVVGHEFHGNQWTEGGGGQEDDIPAGLPKVFYHGTTSNLADAVGSEGLKPFQAPNSTKDKTPAVWLTTNKNLALGYAMKRAKEGGGEPKIFEIRVPARHYVDVIDSDSGDPVGKDYAQGSETQLFHGSVPASWMRALGGPGSGNFGHSGRPGEVGGSGGDSDSSTSDLPLARGANWNDLKTAGYRDFLRQRASKGTATEIVPKLDKIHRLANDPKNELQEATSVHFGLSGEQFANMKEGDTLEALGMRSTTTDPSRATAYGKDGAVFSVKLPKGTAAVDNEVLGIRELTLFPGAKFKVVGESSGVKRLELIDDGRAWVNELHAFQNELNVLAGKPLRGASAKLPVHTIADAAVPTLRKAFLNSIPEEVSEASIVLWESRLREALIPVLQRVVVLSARAHGMTLRLPTVRTAEELRALKPPQKSKPLGMRFDVHNPKAAAWARAHAAKLARDITRETREMIADLIAKGFTEGKAPAVTARLLRDVIGLTARQGESLLKLRDRLDEEGLSGREIDDELDARRDEMIRDRAENIARTETMRASNEGQQELWDQALDEGLLTGNEMKEWIVTPDDRLCELCAPMENVQVGMDEEFETDEGPISVPPLHPQCLLGSTRVVAGDHLEAATKRRFNGDVVVIRVASGRELTCTPNHPILTPSGWVAAGLLDVGSNIVCDGRSQWRLEGIGNHQQVPPCIEDVAHALIESREVLAFPVPVAAEDFHGDGAGSEIAIVGAYRLLRSADDFALAEQDRQQQLVGVHAAVALDGDRSFALLGEGLRSASRRSVSCRDLPGDLLGRHAAPLQSLGFALAPEFDASLAQPHIDTPARETDLVRQLVGGLACEVFTDEVVYVGRSAYSGHVYNLQTSEGWYSANGIISHNCRCTIGLVIPEIKL